MNRKWEGAICVVCGITAGFLLGFDNFMWKESVVINRISVFDVPWLMMVAVCLMRWIYAPHQKRIFIPRCFSLACARPSTRRCWCAAMGIEVAVAMAHLKLGRSFFLGNSIVFLGGLILMQAGAIPALTGLSSTLLGCFISWASHPSRFMSGWPFSQRKPSTTFAGTARWRQLCFSAPFRVRARRALCCRCWRCRLRGARLQHMEAGPWLAGGDRVRRALAAGRVVLFLRTDLGHDRSADAMGLSAHGGGILPRAVPRPV